MSEKDRVQGMLGAAKRWELVKPKLVVAGSSAQAENVLADAIHDIGSLWRACTNADDEIIRLNRELADARNVALEEAATLIDEGFERDINRKQDTCAHRKFGWEDCEQCAAAAIRSLKEKAE